MKKVLTNIKKQKGFAMLFTVLVVTLILSISIGISNLSLKQTILSSLAKDSQISFYEADSIVECGLYYDMIIGAFPDGTDVSTAQEKIECGESEFLLNNSESQKNYLFYEQYVVDDNKPCSTLLFDKNTTPGLNIIQGRGYNICKFENPRQVERALEVQY